MEWHDAADNILTSLFPVNSVKLRKPFDSFLGIMIGIQRCMKLENTVKVSARKILSTKELDNFQFS